MYPKQVRQGVEMGAEVSRHWGSATLQAPQSLGNGEGMGSGLSLEQVAGMACLGSWLSLHRPGPLWHPGEPLNFAGWPWGSVPSPLCHTPCPLLHPAASPRAQPPLWGHILCPASIPPKHLGF